MKHLGDITKISGFSVQTVDCVIGGSPCQGLSVAGQGGGLKDARSKLFLEQIRIVKEMREKDAASGKPRNEVRPRFMLWENVPGAFSSSKGEDFRIVLEETAKIADPDAPDIPLPPKRKWPLADCWYGNGWSIAYRVFDAQFWGVPQRRRRIALVADFGGYAAPEILFIRKSLCWDFGESEAQGEADTPGAGSGVNPTVYCIQGNCIDRADTAGCNGKGWTTDVSYTLNTMDRPAVTAIHMTQDPIAADDRTPCLSAGNSKAGQCSVAVYENHGQDSRLTGPLETAPTVAQKFGTGGNNTPLVMATGQANAEINSDLCPTLNCNHEAPILAAYRFDSLASNSMKSSNPHSGGHFTDICNTLDASPPDPSKNQGGIAILQNAVQAPEAIRSIVRRLTPLECERLQGFPDGWTDIGAWTETNGKIHRESSDSARYKALGNSIALPPWRWVIKRLCGHYERPATMASLFDGIGGFPLIWEQINGQGSCLWASEVEEFPIAVTRKHFPEEER